MADFQGQTAGLRTANTISARIENAAAEAAQLAPLALSASEKVARSGFLPFGRAQVMFNNQTNDEAMNEFATANIGLATAYAGAMARGQKATVTDNEHAREMLSYGEEPRRLQGVVNQMLKEIEAAQRAPKQVREGLRGEVSGKGGHGTPPAAAGKRSTGSLQIMDGGLPDATLYSRRARGQGITKAELTDAGAAGSRSCQQAGRRAGAKPAVGRRAGLRWPGPPRETAKAGEGRAPDQRRRRPDREKRPGRRRVRQGAGRGRSAGNDGDRRDQQSGRRRCRRGKTITGGKFGTQAGIREGEELAGRVAQAGTYQPRTQTGANLTQLVGEGAERSAAWPAWRCPS
jgi:hypothetical protein